MDSKRATEIVVGMAMARNPESPDGEALRMILREVKESRRFSTEAEKIINKILSELDEVLVE